VKRPATVTVLQNGVLVQDNADVMPFPDTPENRVRTRGDILLQSHNDDSEPVSFRNIWLRRLAPRGGRAALSVDLPPDASESQQYAANELCTYIARITGAEPVRNAVADRRIRFVTEESKALGTDGFRLTGKDGVTEIRGSARRGCLYGAYALLERFGGVRFYSSWCEKVPKAKDFTVPDGTDVVETPDFEMRQPFWGDVIRNRAFGAKLRVNGYNHTKNDITAALGGDDFRFGGDLPSCHTFLRLCPTGRYFDTHPEYFSLVKGKRLRKYTQLCLTNPDVLEIVTSNVLERIRKDPGAKFYGVSQEDWDNYCECPACKAIDDEEESHAGTAVRFVNAVAERVEKVYPDVLIETLAYRYTRKPPKKTRLRHNVIPCLCTIECDFARSLDKSPYEQNKAFLSDIVGWSAQTDKLYVWDYVTQFANYPQPFPNVYALQDNVRFFRDHGVKMLFEQGAYEGYHAGFAELKAWLLAKWLWDADLEMKPLLDDFFEGYYGKAAPFVRDYFEKLHAKQLEISSDPKKPLTLYMPVNVPPYTDEAFMSEADRLWEQATEAVKGDETHAYNVRMGRFSHRYARMEIRRHQLGTLEKMRADPAFVALTKDMLADLDVARGPVLLREHVGRSDEMIKAWRTIVGEK